MPTPTFRLSDQEISTRLLTRRNLARLSLGAAAIVAGALERGSTALAQDSTSTPVAADASGADVSMGSFMGLCQALVGGGNLDQARGEQLLAYVTADSRRLAGLHELMAVVDDTERTPIATPMAALSEGARTLVSDILGFWYLGIVDGQPVADRAAAWFVLSAWQAVGYTYAPSVCKGYGQWAKRPAGY